MAQSTEDKAVVKELDTSTRLAYQRTRAAYERTMQAWIRTSASLITFGFTIYKFFQIDQAGKTQHALIGSRTYGELLVIFGLVSLILATFEYLGHLRDLRKEYKEGHPSRLSIALAAAMSLLGLLALIGMLYQA